MADSHRSISTERRKSIILPFSMKTANRPSFGLLSDFRHANQSPDCAATVFCNSDTCAPFAIVAGMPVLMTLR